MRQLDISYDSFIRTTDAKHEVRRPACGCGGCKYPCPLLSFGEGGFYGAGRLWRSDQCCMLAWVYNWLLPAPCLGATCRQHRLTAHATWQAVVRAMLERVWERGDIYKANYEGAPPALIGVGLLLHIC